MSHFLLATAPPWTSSTVVGSSSPVGVEIPLCSRGVSDNVLPHLVLCLPQMVGLGSSHVEDMTLIHCAFTWHSDTVLCNTSALLKAERHPKGMREISRTVWDYRVQWWRRVAGGLFVDECDDTVSQWFSNSHQAVDRLNHIIIYDP